MSAHVSSVHGAERAAALQTRGRRPLETTGGSAGDFCFPAAGKSAGDVQPTAHVPSARSSQTPTFTARFCLLKQKAHGGEERHRGDGTPPSSVPSDLRERAETSLFTWKDVNEEDGAS